MKTRPNNFQLIIYSIFAIGIIYTVYSIIEFRNKELEWEDTGAQKVKVTGIITKFGPGAKSAPTFDYKFRYENNEYNSSDWIPEGFDSLNKDFLKKFEGRKAPIELIRSNPKNSRIIFEELDSIFIKPRKKYE